MYYTNSDIRTYAEAERLFGTAKSPSKGKPLRSFARLLKDGDDYIITVKKSNICRIKRDNTLEFIAENSSVRTHTFTLVGNLHSIIPICISRVGTGRYRVEHRSVLQAITNGPKTRWEYMAKDAPEYFNGIKFDLTTGKCLNRREDMLKSVDVEKRKEWLGLLKVWNRGIKVRMKMGVFSGLIDRRNATDHTAKANIVKTIMSDQIYNSITEGNFDTELLYNIVLCSQPNTWYQQSITQDDVQRFIKNTLATNSIYYRQKFGVLPK